MSNNKRIEVPVQLPILQSLLQAVLHFFDPQFLCSFWVFLLSGNFKYLKYIKVTGFERGVSAFTLEEERVKDLRDLRLVFAFPNFTKPFSFFFLLPKTHVISTFSAVKSIGTPY
jgi:hypothetical protein